MCTVCITDDHVLEDLKKKEQEKLEKEKEKQQEKEQKKLEKEEKRQVEARKREREEKKRQKEQEMAEKRQKGGKEEERKLDTNNDQELETAFADIAVTVSNNESEQELKKMKLFAVSAVCCILLILVLNHG